MGNFEGHNKEEEWSVSTGLEQKFGMNKNLLWRHSNLAVLLHINKLCMYSVFSGDLGKQDTV